MSRQAIKATIDANIRQNGNQEITGNVLNSVLNAMNNEYGVVTDNFNIYPDKTLEVTAPSFALGATEVSFDGTAFTDIQDGETYDEFKKRVAEMRILSVDVEANVVDYGASLDELAKKYTMINVTWIDDETQERRMIATILPSTDTEQGWLYEYCEGWRLCKTSGIVMRNDLTFGEVISYFDGHSERLVTRTLTGKLGDLTTTDKTNLVSAINEVEEGVSELENKSSITDKLIGLTESEVVDVVWTDNTYIYAANDSANYGKRLGNNAYKSTSFIPTNGASVLAVKMMKLSNYSVTPTGLCFYKTTEESSVILGITNEIKTNPETLGLRVLDIPKEAQYFRLCYKNAFVEDFSAKLYTSNISGGEHGEGDIIALNGGLLELTEKFENLNKKQNGSTIGQLVLVHFSDLHNDSANLERVMQIKSKFSAYVNDVIHTGDSVQNYTDDISYWTEKGAENVLNLVGNHDTNNSSGEIYGNGVTPQNVHAKFFAPYLQSWGAVFPQNAATNGYNFYYKDYSESKVRVIALDSILSRTAIRNAGYTTEDAFQQTWFAQVLEDARTNDLGVIVASHFSNGLTASYDCPFSTLAKTSDFYETPNIGWVGVAVNAFMNAGGEFICYLTGHAHYDRLIKLKSFPKQLEIKIGTSCLSRSEQYEDGKRIFGNRSQDCINVLSVDRGQKILRVMRIGENKDRFLREKNSFAYDYANGNIISMK